MHRNGWEDERGGAGPEVLEEGEGNMRGGGEGKRRMLTRLGWGQWGRECGGWPCVKTGWRGV